MSLSPQMDVLYLQGVGHVLGIFTRNSEPTQMETDASAFVGAGLNLRGLVLGENFVIPPALIGVFRTNRVWQQIFQPFGLYASGLPSSPQVTPFSAAAPTLSFATPTLTLAPTPTPADGTTILVLFFDVAGGTPVQFSAPISASQWPLTVPLTILTSGHHYNALALIPTYPIAALTFKAP